MYKIPFAIGNILSWFVYGSERRKRFRGKVNVFLFRPYVARFIKRTYGERMTSFKFVRQRTLNRFIAVANDKYYVKIFRNVTRQQICDFCELMEIVRKALSVEIPVCIVDKKIPMYVCKKNSGISLYSFDKNYVLANSEKIGAQIRNIITQLQSIDVDNIPNNKRFLTNIQNHRTAELPCENCRHVLAHFDLNPSNLLVDKKLNILSVIDWDTISIAKNPNTDWRVFVKQWDIFPKPFVDTEWADYIKTKNKQR